MGLTEFKNCCYCTRYTLTGKTLMHTTTDWLARLIAFDTTSRHSNLSLIHHVADALEGHGLKPWLAHNADHSKANLFVTIPAANGSTEGGLVLSGHTDVMPVGLR